MPQTTPDPVPSPAPKESGGVGATPSAEAVQAPHDAARDWAALSGRWGQRHSAPIPEGLSGLGARGQEPVSPGPTLAEVREEVRRLTGWINDCARAARLPGGMELADVAAGIRAELERERKRANEAIAQLHDAQREFAALRGRVADGGEGMSPTDYQIAAVRTMSAGLDDHGALSMLALGVVGEWGEYVEAYNTPQGPVEAGDVCWYIANLCTVLSVDLATLGLYASSTSIDTAALADIAEPVKKHLYHGKDLDKARVLRGCARLYMGIVYNHDIGEVLAANIDKLRKRWPDGFGVGG